MDGLEAKLFLCPDCPRWLPGSSDMAPAKHGTCCRLRLRVAQGLTAILQTGAFVSTQKMGQTGAVLSR